MFVGPAMEQSPLQAIHMACALCFPEYAPGYPSDPEPDKCRGDEWKDFQKVVLRATVVTVKRLLLQTKYDTFTTLTRRRTVAHVQIVD